MQIIFFNINHAKTSRTGIIDFLNEHRQKTSVFCLQEASDVSETIIDKLLPSFFKIAAYKYITDPDTFHMATYINDKLTLQNKTILMAENPALAPGIYTQLANINNPIHIINYQGLSRPGEKLDTTERLGASEAILKFLSNLQGLKIIGGDFNLLPNTKSLEMFEQKGYINLIKQFGIKSTRNEVVWRRFPKSMQYFSDYVFVTSDVKVRSFEVPYSEISDHLPLILNIDEQL